MGMFTSLFGSSGSDKADKMRQSAIDAFNNIKTPELSALQVQLNDYVNAGKLTPEQAEATLLKSNAFNDIATDPNNTAAQKMALTQLQQIGSEGGMTAIDKAQLQDITNQQNQEAKSRNASVMQNAQQRGVGNSNLTAVNDLMNEQAAADRASQQGTQVAANAQLRALQAMQSAGQLGGQMEAQQYGEQANKANAANAIEQFNTQTQNATNMANVNTANQAQAANLANAQNINNMNTQNQNQNKMYNAQQNQTVYNDQLQKAQGVAGTYNNWANDATAQAKNETGADLALLQGAIGTGAKVAGAAMGGPAGYMAADALTSGGGFDPNSMSTAPKTQKNPYGGYNYADGGMVTPKDEEDFQNFLNEFKPEKKMCSGGMTGYADGGTIPMDKEELVDEHKHLLDTLEHPSEEKLHKEAETQKEEMKDKGFIERMGDLLGSHATAGEKADSKSPYDFKSGGKVPGMAHVPGNSHLNDTVPAKLSPGEVVLPRTVVANPERIPSFVEKSVKPHDHFSTALKSLMKTEKEKVK